MYRRSLRDLQTDYLDYYLLHAVGGDKGIETFNERFIDCGVLDFLIDPADLAARRFDRVRAIVLST